MIDLKKLTPFGRKTWAIKKYKDWEESRNTKAIKESRLVYFQPTDECFKDKLDRAKWKTAVDRKVNYLLARPPVDKTNQAQLDGLLTLIKESAIEFTLRGSLIWIVQGDGVTLEKRPFIMNDTLAIYKDERQEEVVAVIHKYTDIEVEPSTGAETEIEFYECYYDNERDIFCVSQPDRDKHETLAEKPLFIELGKTGDAPLYAYTYGLLRAFDTILKHQDTTTEKNTKPLVEVKGYSGTEEEDIEYAVNMASIVKTDGNGGVTIHTRNMDSASVETWQRRLLQEYYEATATVGKEQELQYAASGKALDRLFIDMDYSAGELGAVIEGALKIYFEYIGLKLDIVWNTDRPVDDAAIIGSIAQSQGILSEETLLEQHPWVTNVQEEIARIRAQQFNGMDDLLDDGGKTPEIE